MLTDCTLKGHYNELDFFNDKAVYDGTFKPSDSEMQSRVEKNHEIYRKVCDIMNNDDDTDKIKLLQKFLDERLSKKVVKDDSWQNIDYQEFLDSIERKAATANLELLDIELPSEGLMTSIVKYTKGNPKKKSTSYIIVCDTIIHYLGQIRQICCAYTVILLNAINKVFDISCIKSYYLVKIIFFKITIKHHC